MNDPSKKISADDPSLTAYALGELAGEDRAALAAAVAADPALASEVNKIRAFSAQLRRSLADEPAPVVEAVTVPAPTPETAAPVPPRRAKIIRGPFYLWVATAAAACFALIAWLHHPAEPGLTPSQVVAVNRVAAPPVVAVISSPVVGGDKGPAEPPTAPARDVTIAEKLGQPSPLPAAPVPARALKDSIALGGAGSGALSPGNATPSDVTDNLANAAKKDTGTFTLSSANTYAGGPTDTGGANGLASAGASALAGPIAGGRAGGGAGGRRGGGGGGIRGGAAGGRLGGGRSSAMSPIVISSSSPVNLTIEPAVDWGYRYPSLPADAIVIRRRPPPPAPYSSSGEGYLHLQDNAFTDPAQSPLSTFALDVNTASYANLRRFLTAGRLPPPDAVRIEELVNYFPYDYARLPAAQPAGPAPAAAPFWVNLAAASAPWSPSHRLVRVAIKARDVSTADRGAANLVFLLDVSGSMSLPNKLPLVKESMRLLLARLRPDDRVAIVTYANGSGVALPPTPVSQRDSILAAVDALNAGGGTNGGAGIQLAYQVAQENLNREGVNRIILCTDGDFNVGLTGPALLSMVGEQASGGVSLTVLGFGTGNLKDNLLEQLAGQGRGDYGYIDTRPEAQKLFVEQLGSTLVTVARDVKLQVEFNPSRVAAYRLLGYEDRLLAASEFNNDRVGAGDVGAGHTVTALYEIVPVGGDYGYPYAPGVDPLRYTATTPPARADSGRPAAGADSNELLTVKVRYKLPGAENMDHLVAESKRMDFPFVDRGAKFEEADADFQFAAAVAGFGLVLRDSPYRGSATASDVLVWAARGAANDPDGHRAEFMDLVRRARDLRREPVGAMAPGRAGSDGPAPGVDPLRY